VTAIFKWDLDKSENKKIAKKGNRAATIIGTARTTTVPPLVQDKHLLSCGVTKYIYSTVNNSFKNCVLRPSIEVK
jgi:hypothetical protein